MDTDTSSRKKLFKDPFVHPLSSSVPSKCPSAFFCGCSHHPPGWRQTPDGPMMHLTPQEVVWVVHSIGLANDPGKTHSLGKLHALNLLPKARAHWGETPGCHLASRFILSGTGRNPALDRPRHIALACIERAIFSDTLKYA